MKNLMSFSGSALSRAEMKVVKGGTCLAEKAGPNKSFSTMQEAKNYAKQYGGHWCCSSCSTATWTYCGSKANNIGC
jgi:hypothetical protein